MNNIVNFINNTVFCTLRASPIRGVGVFAIKDIGVGQKITDYTGQSPVIYEVTEEEFNMIDPEIQTLIKQRTIFIKDRPIRFNSPNAMQLLEAFMNHSESPNCDGSIAIKTIKKGEELTKDYNVFILDGHPLNLDILNI